MEEIVYKNQSVKLNEQLSFDAALEELETRVHQLEDGKLPLEEALECFKEGIGLVQICNLKLKEAETIIKELTLDNNGMVIESQPEIKKDRD